MRYKFTQLFHKHQIDGAYKQSERQVMVPAYLEAFERECAEDNEDHKRDYFLHDFELHERVRAAVAFESNAVGRNLTHIFKQCYSP